MCSFNPETEGKCQIEGHEHPAYACPGKAQDVSDSGVQEHLNYEGRWPAEMGKEDKGTPGTSA